MPNLHTRTFKESGGQESFPNLERNKPEVNLEAMITIELSSRDSKDIKEAREHAVREFVSNVYEGVTDVFSYRFNPENVQRKGKVIQRTYFVQGRMYREKECSEEH